MCAQLANSAFVNGTCLGRATMLALKFGVLHPRRHFGGQRYKALEDLMYTKRKQEKEIGRCQRLKKGGWKSDRSEAHKQKGKKIGAYGTKRSKILGMQKRQKRPRNRPITEQKRPTDRGIPGVRGQFLCTASPS